MVEPARLIAAHAAALAFYESCLARAAGPATYLRRRGFGALVDRAEPWHAGYAPRTWTALTEHLRERGFTTGELLTAGLVRTSQHGRTYDLFRDRIVLPIYNTRGDPIAFIGRTWRPPDPTSVHIPKYLNSPQTPLYRKGEQLFGLAQQRDRLDAGWSLVLVEGPLDAIAIWLAYSDAGSTGMAALAPCGTALTSAQVETLMALPGFGRSGIVLAYDNDEPGRTAADRAYELLADDPSRSVRGVVLPGGTDPAGLLASPGGPARLRDLLDNHTQPQLHLALEHRLDQMLRRSPRMLHEVEGRMAIAARLAPLIAEQPATAAVAAIRHLAAHVRIRLEEPNVGHLLGELIYSLTNAVCIYLETSPSPSSRARTGLPTAATGPTMRAPPTPRSARRSGLLSGPSAIPNRPTRSARR